MVWDLVLTPELPKAYQAATFWKNIPACIVIGENLARTLFFILALLMPLHVATPIQKKGMFLYVSGLLLYFASWLPLLIYPASAWSNSASGFCAPAYTPLLWLWGIALMGDSFYFGLYFRRWFFMLILIIFIVFHNLHTYIVYCRAS